MICVIFEGDSIFFAGGGESATLPLYSDGSEAMEWKEPWNLCVTVNEFKLSSAIAGETPDTGQISPIGHSIEEDTGTISSSSGLLMVMVSIYTLYSFSLDKNLKCLVIFLCGVLNKVFCTLMNWNIKNTLFLY